MDTIYYWIGFPITWLLIAIFFLLVFAAVVAIIDLLIFDPIKQHLYEARVNKHRVWMRSLLQSDYQWLGHNSIARAICDRHLQMLQDDWRKQEIQDISKFRDEIGLYPYKGRE